ncbi:TPA: transposase [Enterococcus faecium]
MNQFNKEIAQALLENTNLTEVFRNQLESTMNSLLESELTAILGYDPYVRFNNGNYRNGDYTRRLDTQFGQMVLLRSLKIKRALSELQIS